MMLVTATTAITMAALAIVGVVEPSAAQRWLLRLADGSRPFRAVAVVGQAGGRLRMCDRVVPSPAAGTLAPAAEVAKRGCPDRAS